MSAVESLVSVPLDDDFKQLLEIFAKADGRTLPAEMVFRLRDSIYGEFRPSRVQIAAMAMQALIGTAAAPCLTGLEGAEPTVAAAAFRMADALLEQSYKEKTW